MAVTCKNCGRPVKFDPDTQRVSCDYCGSKFVPETIEEYGKDFLEQIEPSLYLIFILTVIRMVTFNLSN